MSSRPEPVYFDSHMHTPLCKHAMGDPEDYAAAGRAAGLRGIIVTCHSPMPDGFWPEVRMGEDELPEYLDLVARASAGLPDGFEVKVGIESDFFPGTESFIERLHASAPFHHCLGSVHFFGPEYQDRYWRGDLEEFQRLYYTHVADSAETGLFDTLAHPDLIKNAVPERYDFARLERHIARCLDRVAATGVAMELNTSGRHKRFPEMNPGPAVLRMMADRGIPVVLGSDAHHPRRVAEGFPEALALLEEAGFKCVSYFDRRQRVDVPVSRVAGSLAAAVAA
jgi:histidinol-phosphatase (PHP family)